MRRGEMRRLARLGAAGLCALCLAAACALALSGCSDDAPPEDRESVTGKTPVVRPEDVHRRSPGGAAVLSPDYRQSLAADLEQKAENVPAAGAEPGANRLFTGRPSTVPAVKAEQAASPPVPQAAPVAAPPRVAQVAPPAAPQPAPLPASAGSEVAAAPVSGRAEALQGASSKDFPVAACRQLVLVTAQDFAATKGLLRRFSRQGPDAPWREEGAATPCTLGRHGLGIGRGLVPLSGGPEKKQGDGRTPAGLFSLPEAFGYADAAAAKAAGVRLPYQPLTDRTACVTDAASPLFGRVVGPDARTAAGVTRQERMVRDDRANVWGVVIGHNRDASDPGAGACVFLNMRPASGQPTGGAVGCPEEVAAGIAAWLDPAAAPVVAVLPERLYREGRQGWGLP